MMKLILYLTLIWTLSSTAEALWCWISAGTENYPKLCKSAELCAIVATTQVIKNGKVKHFTNRWCVPSSLYGVGDHNLSHNIGFGATTKFIRVCNTNRCNYRDIPYPGDQKENNLQCFTCDDPSSAVCDKTLQCVGEQDRCMNVTVGDDSGNTTRLFGCVSANLCRKPSQLLDLPFLHEPKCCESSFCNSAWSVKLNVIPLLFGLFTLIVY
ncbi:urokinase plasminogen activator surface receptor-like [Thunnus albacares]|uniref:urokinase plasminogen activator surface receptor-like n=1 Tax=Thunnus albacares TaxID=8236 RepID=UPI001CF6392E|nr:urokinase plasminogen activator surface receptor-like [Thunnus albacares]